MGMFCNVPYKTLLFLLYFFRTLYRISMIGLNKGRKVLCVSASRMITVGSFFSFFIKIYELCHRGFQPSPTQKGPTAAEDE